jgi:hypothetical protein
MQDIPRRMTLSSVSLLALGIFLIVFPAISYNLINAFLVLTGIKFTLENAIFLLQNMWLFDALPKIVGAILLIVIVVRARMKMNYSKLKRQLLLVSNIGIFWLLIISVVYVDIPVTKAEATVITGYYLATTFPVADCYIGKYSEGNYFALNGSNWANLMTSVAPTPWFTYSRNYTQVTELALSNITYGTVYLKEVPFNLALMSSIPPNVTVIDNFNGFTYTYINSMNSLGSPYTVSVGQGNNAGYYVATDCGKRILFASLDGLSVIQSCINSEINSTNPSTTIQLQSGIFNGTAGLTYNPAIRRALIIEGAGYGFETGTTLFLNNPSVIQSAIKLPSSTAVNSSLVIRDLNVEVVLPTVGVYDSPAIWIDQSCEFDMENCFVITYNSIRNGSVIPLNSSVGIQMGHSGFTLSGDTKILNNVEVLGFETAHVIGADWVTIDNSQVYFANRAAYEFIGAPIRPIMDHCHAYTCGGPNIILDNRLAHCVSPIFTLQINDFYAEGETLAGFNNITSYFYQENPSSISVNDFYPYYGFGVDTAKEFDANYGTAISYVIGNQEGVLVPHSAPIDWNRDWSNNTLAASEGYYNGSAYRNVNMATMHLTVQVRIPYSGINNYTDILGMSDINPFVGVVYTTSYVFTKTESIASPGTNNAFNVVSLSLDVPPGWWFFVSLEDSSWLVGYTITYSAWNRS